MSLVSRTAALTIGLALFVATPGSAQSNRVTNGSFDLDVFGWEPDPEGACPWDPKPDEE